MARIIYKPKGDEIMSDDPWQDRCDLMKCKTCMWFVFKKGIRKGIGRCRKRAPTLNGYPVVYTDDFCGDHKVDENKV